MAKAAKRRDADVIDVGTMMPIGSALPPSASDDEVFVHSAGLGIIKFLHGVAAFFTTATAIEAAAVTTLEKARALRPPTDGVTDLAIQKFILKTVDDRKAAETHWSVTGTISQFHRRMTGARKRATDPLEEASRIGNALHNAYVDNERRRAEAEQRRVDEEARQKQQAIRDAELADLEAKALEAEEAAIDLSDREQAFVDAYFAGIGTRENGQASARRAGFKNPMKDAARLLTLPKIQRALEGRRAAQQIRAQAAAVKLSPKEPVHIDEVRADVQKASGARTRTTWSADVTNAQALIDAAFRGEVPRDLLVLDLSRLNDYAGRLMENLDRWPGVKAVKKTSTF